MLQCTWTSAQRKKIIDLILYPYGHTVRHQIPLLPLEANFPPRQSHHQKWPPRCQRTTLLLWWQNMSANKYTEKMVSNCKPIAKINRYMHFASLQNKKYSNFLLYLWYNHPPFCVCVLIKLQITSKNRLICAFIQNNLRNTCTFPHNCLVISPCNHNLHRKT